MANPEQLEILKQGVQVWNKWREENLDEKIDLEEADLWGANLVGANLRGANLRGAILGVANLQEADLRGANLLGANLIGTNLDGANLQAANLQEANLDDTRLQGIILRDAILHRANLARANLVEASLDGANLRGANLDGTNLDGARFYGASFYGADLRGANLDGVIFRGTDKPLQENAAIDFLVEKKTFAENALMDEVKQLNKERDLLLMKLSSFEQEISQLTVVQIKLKDKENAYENNIMMLYKERDMLRKNLESFQQKISHLTAERTQLEKIKQAEIKQMAAEGFSQQMRYEQTQREAKYRQNTWASKEFKISIAHPKLLSKRNESRFLVQIYLPRVREQVLKKIRSQFNGQESTEHIENSKLETEQEVRLHFSSPDITFLDDIIKKLDREINITNFMAKPSDNCEPGDHQVILSISDRETGFEYESIVFTVTVKDFAFDHVSRPLLSKVSSVALGAGSLSIFILTLMGQIDTTFGLTSGTVAAAVASAIVFQFSKLYQQTGTVHTP